MFWDLRLSRPCPIPGSRQAELSKLAHPELWLQGRGHRYNNV